MAKAEKKPKDDFEVVLTLSKDEAETLMTLVANVAGSSSKTRRKHTDNIHGCLDDLGIQSQGFELHPDFNTIRFKEDTNF